MKPGSQSEIASAGVRLGPYAACAIVSFLMLSSCGEIENPLDLGDAPDPPNVLPFVTAEIAAQLDSQGHFVLPYPEPMGAEPIITPQRALDLATAYLRSYFWNDSPPPAVEDLRHTLEKEHGRHIDWKDVRPLPDRTYFAESAYRDLPVEVPLFVRRAFGPAYQVPLAAHGIQVAVLSVAAYSTDLSIDQQGLLAFPAVSGGEFDVCGIPRTVTTWIPMSPEEAVRDVAARTGARVQRIPRLTRTGNPVASYYAKWEVALDRAIHVRISDSGDYSSVAAVYLGAWQGLNIEWFAPSQLQPTGDTIRYPTSEGDKVVYAKFREDIPVRFDRVTPTVK